jgi:hypothetical protein
MPFYNRIFGSDTAAMTNSAQREGYTEDDLRRLTDEGVLCDGGRSHIRYYHHQVNPNRDTPSRWSYTCYDCTHREVMEVNGRIYCGDPYCETCYPRPTGPSHMSHFGYNQLIRGRSPWSSRINPCRRGLSCHTCHPSWSLTLPELSQRRQEELEGRREAERQERRDVRRREIVDTSRTRAAELLTSLLTEEQNNTYKEYGFFKVVGSNGGVYDITKGYSGNVRIVENESEQMGHWERYRGKRCAHPEMYHEIDMGGDLGSTDVDLPEEDAMIAQMLMITTDERAFLNVSNPM